MCHAFAAEGRENIPIHKSVFSKVQCTLVPKENRLIYILHKKTLHSIKNMTIMQTLENVKVVFKSSTLVKKRTLSTQGEGRSTQVHSFSPNLPGPLPGLYLGI